VIEVTNLSSITETESFRVDGLGNARLLVVQCTLDQYPEIPKSDPIRDLKSQLGELKTEKSARKQEVTILKAYGKSMSDKPHLAPDQANAFSDTLYDKILACAETVRDLDERITQLNQKINKLQSSKVGAAYTKAMITILADEDGLAKLRLIYREWWWSVIGEPTHLSHRCTQRPLGPSLRLIRNFGRRKTISIGLPSLPCQSLAKHRRGLDKREAHPQHICHGYSERRDTETR
jgi:hypothetical protein